MITVLTPPNEYFKAKNALSEILGDTAEFEVDEITFIPQTTITIDGDDIEMFEKFIDMLNDNDDVQNVYHNVEI